MIIKDMRSDDLGLREFRNIHDRGIAEALADIKMDGGRIKWKVCLFL